MWLSAGGQIRWSLFTWICSLRLIRMTRPVTLDMDKVEMKTRYRFRFCSGDDGNPGS